MANANGWGDGSVNNSIGWGKGAINNSIGWGSSQLTSWSGATDIDGGDAPTNTVAPAITGTAQEGQTLTCSTGTWTGSPTYTYQWKRNGNNITSATNSTYTLVTADVGQSIKCTVTATNVLGSANADSNTVTPTASTDADAQAFITAAGITDNTQKSAINQLVVDLKGYNIWAKMKAIYPIVGGSASSHKWNLKDPRDLDAAFRLTFASGWTHSSTGMTPLNTYADTFLKFSTSLGLNSAHLSYYSRTNSNGAEVEIGVMQPGTNYSLLEIRTSNTTYFLINQTGFTTATDLDSRGFYIANRQSSNDIDGWKQGTKLVNGTAASNAIPNINTYIGAYNNVGTAAAFTTKQCAFASIGDGLTDADAANFYTAVQAFQTTLSRQI